MKQRYKIKATIFDKRGMILSIGENSYIKSHPYMSKLACAQGTPLEIYLHAEVAAILKCADLSKARRIMVTRVNSNDELRLAKPCPICQSAIRAAGIKVVEHS